MNSESIGAMISRAVGVVLIITGASSLLSFLPMFTPADTAIAGWTSYSSLVTNVSSLHLHDSYYVVGGGWNALVPGIVQAAAGLLMIFLCQPMGRLLARGLNKPDGPSTTEPTKTAD